MLKSPSHPYTNQRYPTLSIPFPNLLLGQILTSIFEWQQPTHGPTILRSSEEVNPLTDSMVLHKSLMGGCFTPPIAIDGSRLHRLLQTPKHSRIIFFWFRICTGGMNKPPTFPSYHSFHGTPMSFPSRIYLASLISMMSALRGRGCLSTYSPNGLN